MNILERILGRREKRGSLEDPEYLLSEPGLLQLFGIGGSTDLGINVNENKAMQVPAFGASVNFLSGTLASLPLHVYKTDSTKGQVRVSGTISDLLGHAVNDEMTSFDWRKSMFTNVFTNGRGLTYIERNRAGNPVNLFPIPSMRPKYAADGRKYYECKNRAGNTVAYSAADVIDIPFLVKSDFCTHLGPLELLRDTIALAIASQNYGSKVFKKGGLPPLALQGPFSSAAGAKRAADDIVKAISQAYEEGRPALAIPVGHELKPLGFKPEEMQMIDLMRFLIEQIARVFSLPPTFLQDLSNGTHSNTEQQDLHFVKHTLNRWTLQVEQELNLKLFGRKSRSKWVKFNTDGLLRGDFKTRMEGIAQGVQNGFMTPNEARALEGRPAVTGGDEAYIQGATMPLKTQQNATLTNKAVSNDE